MIFSLTETTRYYFYQEPVDMRKGIHSLYHMVKTKGQLDAFNGDCYIFMNKTRKSIKILIWQREGFVLYNKKLELGCYSLPVSLNKTPFMEVKIDALNHIINTIKHKSSTNEFRKKAMTTL